MFLEGIIILATMYANISVPVVPDPNYLQQLYPMSPLPPPQLSSTPTVQDYGGGSGGGSNNVAANGYGGAGGGIEGGGAQPTDIMGIISLAVTAGLGYFFQKQKTITDRRTYMAADTSLKLAQNDQYSDAKVVKLTYAVSCLADIVGKYHKEDMETYETTEGVSLWTYIENLNIEANHDFKARYLSKPPVKPTGSQSKDKVVATLIDVQQSITPTPVVEAPNVTKPTGHTRPEINKEGNSSSS